MHFFANKREKKKKREKKTEKSSEDKKKFRLSVCPSTGSCERLAKPVLGHGAPIRTNYLLLSSGHILEMASNFDS